MKFELIIEADGNDAMKSRVDVAFALDAVARRLRHNTDLPAAPIQDLAGTQVGMWYIEADVDTGVHRSVGAQVDELFDRTKGED